MTLQILVKKLKCILKYHQYNVYTIDIIVIRYTINNISPSN